MGKQIGILENAGKSMKICENRIKISITHKKSGKCEKVVGKNRIEKVELETVESGDSRGGEGRRR